MKRVNDGNKMIMAASEQSHSLKTYTVKF